MIQQIDKKYMEMNGHGLRLWLPLQEMDDEAKQQVACAAHQPYVVDDIMVMPDAHGGYIVKGRGNIQAYDSCSHGAGRTMSRRQAKESLSFEGELLKLSEAEVCTPLTDLSESPGAYKDLDIVMERQKDLVDIVHQLKPIFTVKGSTK